MGEMPRNNERLLARVMLGGTVKNSGEGEGDGQYRFDASIVEIRQRMPHHDGI